MRNTPHVEYVLTTLGKFLQTDVGKQCKRLSHQCDYSPRVSFRDDTQRIMGRMQGVSTRGSVVWDRGNSYPNLLTVGD